MTVLSHHRTRSHPALRAACSRLFASCQDVVAAVGCAPHGSDRRSSSSSNNRADEGGSGNCSNLCRDTSFQRHFPTTKSSLTAAAASFHANTLQRRFVPPGPSVPLGGRSFAAQAAPLADGRHAGAGSGEGSREGAGDVAGDESSRAARAGSVDGEEVAKFEALAHQWWDRHGPHAPLHAMTPTRISFIRSALCRQFNLNHDSLHPLTGLRLLDVGCGGGLLAEPLARLGASVTGIDVTAVNIRVAQAHAARDPTTRAITYRCVSAEELSSRGERFDAVLSLEVLEHVLDPAAFIHTLTTLCGRPEAFMDTRSRHTQKLCGRPEAFIASGAHPIASSSGNGPSASSSDGDLSSPPSSAVFLSTINRTARSFALAVAAAEYVMGMVPIGTHDWSKFITPVEMALMLRRANWQLHETSGMVFNPLRGKWHLSANDVAVNYIAMATPAS